MGELMRRPWTIAIDRLESEPRKNWQDVVAVLRGLDGMLTELQERLQTLEAALPTEAATSPPEERRDS
jgi:hypothetical protein